VVLDRGFGGRAEVAELAAEGLRTLVVQLVDLQSLRSQFKAAVFTGRLNRKERQSIIDHRMIHCIIRYRMIANSIQFDLIQMNHSLNLFLLISRIDVLI
jgi:hypothetical protein